MPEETAFSVLVKIMFEYKHRELFKSGFYSLHCSLFTLDKLIEVNTNICIYPSLRMCVP